MLYINGRFLTQRITGVQRYAIEIVKELDKIVSDEKVEILCPNEELLQKLDLHNIRIRKIGRLRGHAWEQITLPLFVKKRNGQLLSLCNIAPILNPGYITIHDISFKTHREHLKWYFSLWYRIITRFNIKRYKHIFTVSNYSKNEILANYNINPLKISITYNSANHLKNVKKDSSILERFNLKKEDFHFSLGSNSLHKNFQFIYKLAKKYSDKLFVVTGNNNSKVFGDNGNPNLENLIYTGYLKDEELASLYSSCKAFIFPSLYEGFGIPPLEAIMLGCDYLILSDIPVLREIYGNNAVFIDTINNIELPKNLVFCNRNVLLKKYLWMNSAKKIKKVIGEI